MSDLVRNKYWVKKDQALQLKIMAMEVQRRSGGPLDVSAVLRIILDDAFNNKSEEKKNVKVVRRK